MKPGQSQSQMAHLVQRAHDSAGTPGEQQAMDAAREAVRYVLRRLGSHPSR